MTTLDSAKGGHLNHQRILGTSKALCGFKPKAKVIRGRQMNYRHGWHGRREYYALCAKCAVHMPTILEARVMPEVKASE